jgi:hypothetical protein
MHMAKAGISLLLLLVGLFYASTAQADGVYGDFIIDWSYIAGHHLDGQMTSDSTIMDLDGWNGFQLRRVRIGFKRSLTPELAMNFRLEASQPDFYTSLGYSGSGAAPAVATPFVKDAYVTWTVADGVMLQGGLQANPMNTNPEAVWGYRQIEKIVLDLHGLESSRDLGVAMIGNFDQFYFTTLLANGQGDKSESYRGKQIYAVAGYMPLANTYIEAGLGYEREAEGQTHTTFQGFLGYNGTAFHGGLQYDSFTRSYSDDTEDLKINAFSAFAGVPLTPQFEAIGRYDMVDENPAANGISQFHMANYAPTNTIIAGLAYTPIANFQIIPNVEYVSYGDPEDSSPETPDPDTFVRVTLWNKW